MRKFFKSALFIIALAGVAAFAACGSSERGPSRTVGEYLADRSLLYGTTIAIAHVPQIRVGGTQRQHFGMELLAQRFMLANPGITIEFRAFDSPEQATELIGLDLMSGMSEFTLINSLGIDWRSPVVTRLFLADWFEIMNAAPDFNPDDWFMNVFDAMAKDGRLHVFPTDFRYEVVVANSSVPGLAEAFARYDFITHSDLQRLHQEFSTEQQPYMFFAYNIHWGVMYNLENYVNIAQGAVHFQNSDFEQVIMRAQSMSNNATSFIPFFSGGMPFFYLPGIQNDHYIFDRASVPPTIQPFFQFENDYFQGGYAFMVDHNGKLLINNFAPAFALSNGATPAQKAVAWDFMMFIQNPANIGGITVYNDAMQGQPLYKPFFRRQVGMNVAAQLPNIRDNFGMRLTSPNIAHQSEIIGDTLYAMGNMPMRHIQTVTRPIENIIHEVLEQFHDGLIDARQAAEYLQNRITIVLMEMD